MATKKTICVDLTTVMKRGEMKDMETRKGTLYRSSEYKYLFVETGARVKRMLWKCWMTIARCLYGKATVNADHVQVQYYIPHSAYRDTRELADIILEQAEQLADGIEHVKLDEIVESLRTLKPIMEDAA